MQDAKGKSDYFKFNPRFNRWPMERIEHWGYIVIFSSTGYQSYINILNSLKLFIRFLVVRSVKSLRNRDEMVSAHGVASHTRFVRDVDE